MKIRRVESRSSLLASSLTVLAMLAAACGGGGSSESARTEGREIRFGNNVAVVDAQLAWALVGMHPDLGFYESADVEPVVTQTGGTAGAWAGIATGQVGVAPISTSSHLGLAREDPDHPGISVYSWLVVPHWFIGVLPDSDIQSYEDLRGKRIGIRDQGDTGYFGVRGMLAAAGLNPDTDVEFVTVGPGAPGGVALENGTIDALAHWDAEYGRIENAGFQLRYIGDPLEDRTYADLLNMPGNTWVINRESLQADREMWEGFFRAMAQSTYVYLEDPELAIQLFWEVYPESKPPGLAEDEALREAANVAEFRAPRLDPSRNAPESNGQFGWQSAEQWQNVNSFFDVGFSGDFANLFSTEVVAGANDWDPAELDALIERLREERSGS